MAVLTGPTQALGVGSGRGGWWLLVTAVYVPLFVIGAFLCAGMVERVGYFWRGRTPSEPGSLPILYESLLTRAQSLWVDDHHTVQMSWRSERWGSDWTDADGDRPEGEPRRYKCSRNIR